MVNVKPFSIPFYVDIMMYMKSLHAKALAKYNAILDALKKQFFDQLKFKNILTAYFETEKALKFIINGDNVDVVISNILFNVNDKESPPTREQVLSIFLSCLKMQTMTKLSLIESKNSTTKHISWKSILCGCSVL